MADQFGLQDITLQDKANITAVDDNFKKLSTALGGVKSEVDDMGGLSDTTPLMNGTAAPGTAESASRSDHVHPSDTTKINTSQKGAASGVASLDANTKVVAEQASARIVNVTASKTLALTDSGVLQRANSSSAITITVPASTNVPFPIETEIEVVRWNSGSVTFAGATGATIYSIDNAKSIANRYGTVILKKINNAEWLLVGDLE